MKSMKSMFGKLNRDFSNMITILKKRSIFLWAIKRNSYGAGFPQKYFYEPTKLQRYLDWFISC